MADQRDILIRLLGEETVSRMADRASGGLDRFGDKLDATEKDADALDRQIAEVEGSLKQLAVAFARTNDAADRIDITKAIRKQQTELRRLTRAKDFLDGDEAATGFAAAFVGRLGPLIARAPLGPAGAALGAIVGVPLAAVLGATVSAALLGGVGGAGIIGGITLASKDARVQAAGKQLAATVTADLEDSATRFISPTIHGIGIIRSAWEDVADDVDGVFESTAGQVEPLARGVAGLVRELAPALHDAAEAAGPVIRELSDGLPRIGAALGGLLRTAADNADEAASAVRFIVMGLEAGINVTSTLISGLGGLYRVLVIAGTAAADFTASLYGWLPVIGDQVKANRDRMHELRDALDNGGDAGQNAADKIVGGFQKVGDAADTSAQQVETWADVVRDSTSRALASENANLRLEEAIDRAAEAAKTGAEKGINPNTEAGRRNRRALLDIAEAANAASADIFKNTQSHELAAEATERGRKKFLEAADAMGVESSKAKTLADRLFGIPRKVDSKVTVTANTQPAIDNARSVVRRINSMKARINVTAEVHGSFGGGAHTGFGYSTGMSQGGYVDGPGPKGVDSRPALLAPGEGVLTAAEVDAVGGRAGFDRLRAAIRSGIPMAGVAPAPVQPQARAAAPDRRLDEESLYRAFVRALQTLPVARDPGHVASIYKRSG